MLFRKNINKTGFRCLKIACRVDKNRDNCSMVFLFNYLNLNTLIILNRKP